MGLYFGGNDISELPLILCGPIVRRTEPDRVCVWVALREAAEVELTLFDSDGGARGAERLRGRHATVALAARLHVAAVSATLEPGGEPLVWGSEYLYHLGFDVDGRFRDLYDNGVLRPRASRSGDLRLLRYPGRELPGFRLPAAGLGSVRVAHGSCRKAHGEGREALVSLDRLLAGPDPPQQLFLTGDQIYADNVDPAVLTAILEIGEELHGGPDPEKARELGAFAPRLVPGQRLELVKEHGFTSRKASCHLVTLAEFYVMYLLAWSDVFWNRVDLSDSPDRKRQKVIDDIKAYRASQPAVRRALANLSTYMIFDDHEVSDDWNLTRKWVDDVTSSELGPRIVRNALVAYALYQHWGNDPAAFAPGAPGGALLDAVDGWDGTAGTAAERVRERVYVPPPGGELEPIPAGALRWHYTYDAPQYRVVALDCRTRRHYRERETPPGLMSKAAIDGILEVEPPIQPATIVLSPTPVLGIKAIDFLQRLFLRLIDSGLVNDDPDSVDPEAWSLDRETHDHLLDRLALLRRVVVLSGDVHYGFAASLVGREIDVRIVNFISSALHNQTFARTATWLINRGASPLEMVAAEPEEVPATNAGSTPGFAWEEELLGEDAAAPGDVELEAFAASRRRDNVVGSCNVGEVVFGDGKVEQLLHWRRKNGRRKVTRHVATFPVA